MTPQELNDRIGVMFAITKELTDGSPDKGPAKHLLYDVIQAVTPSNSTELVHEPKSPSEYLAFKSTVETIRENTKNLLGEKR